MNFEKDSRIDESSLDIEWLEQPSLMMRYAIFLGNCISDYERAKENVELVKATIGKKIRDKPSKYFGDGKATEAGILWAITVQDEYQEALDDMMNKRHQMEIAKIAVKAIEQRKDALENLVRLYGQQYFAGPKVPRNISNEREKRIENRKKANNKVRLNH